MADTFTARSIGDRVIQVLGSAVLIIAILYWAREILIPLAFAVLMTFILSPLVIRLQRIGLPKSLAVSMTVLVTFAILGTITWSVAAQLRNLLIELPQHREEIEAKIRQLKGTGLGPLAQFVNMINDIAARLQGTGPPQTAPPAEHVNQAPSWSWIAGAVGTGLEFLISAFFMALLVVFMLAMRENLRDRFFLSVGRGRLALMTRAVDEAAQRISRYLLMLLAVNIIFGLLVALCLFLVPNGAGQYGLPYPLLWGMIAACLRFVPYLGTWVGLALPLLMSAALSPVTHPLFQPLLIVCIYVAIEVVTANAVEPVLYGRNAGVSPVALLVAALFWTWLWGPLGLLLSTPLTVVLVVLGKYVPGLGLLHVFLGDEPVVEKETSFYQRLLAHDEDEASELVQNEVKSRPPNTVYDDVLAPALVLARQDKERGTLTPEDEKFVLEVTRRVADEVVAPAVLAAVHPENEAPADRGKVSILGCPARDEMDEVALHLLALLLEPDGVTLEIVSSQSLTSEMVSRVRDEQPSVVCIGVPMPGGLAQAGYLCKRLRSNYPDLKIVVGRWGQTENIAKMEARLMAAGATIVLTTLLETRRELVAQARVAAAATA